MTNELIFIHLSDIHFGQERGGNVIIHKDVRDRLIDDVAAFRAEHKIEDGCSGVIITGDIAYSGRADEYRTAEIFLDQLTAAAGCDRTDVQVIPGNHDIDLELISPGAEGMLAAVAKKGESELDRYLENDSDRASLFTRFREYERFANGYGCSLDAGGGHAGEKRYELQPSRTVAIRGLNSAMACRKGYETGDLLLGSRQRVVPIEPGVEWIILSHHPLSWMKDGQECSKYFRNRARVFMSGHEHNPNINVEQIEPGKDHLTIAAGATNPPSNEEYTYCYNVISLKTDEKGDSLRLTVWPRRWLESTQFGADSTQVKVPNEQSRTIDLGCPNFRSIAAHVQAPKAPAVKIAVKDASIAGIEDEVMSKQEFAHLRLLFFRELNAAKRLKILADLGALPSNITEQIPSGIMLRAFDGVVQAGKIDDLKEAISRELVAK